MDEHAASKRSHSEAIDENNEDTSLFVEDDTDRVPAYDATKEPLPDCKVNTSEYCIIADGKDKISNLVESPFSESPFRSGPTDGLLEDLKKRVKDRSSDKIKVGVVGDMSSGTSVYLLLLNTSLTTSRQELRYQLPAQRGCDCSSGVSTCPIFTLYKADLIPG